MKKYLIKATICLLLLAVITACNDDYFDVNTPSGTATEDQLRMEDLLAPVIHSTMEGQRSAELVFGNYVQNFVSEGGGAIGESQVGGLWEQIYLYILPNIKVIKTKAEANQAIHYNAIADILTAINLGIATDTWDNIPYSQANQELNNLKPSFDTQESIYNEIFKLLDGAIVALQQEDKSVFSKIKNDLIYKGDVSKWLRAAYTLKARYQLHLVSKGIVSPNDVLTTIAKGFTSNSDNFMMFYDDKNINPWHSSEVLAANTGNFHRDIASQLISSMNGDYYPFSNPLLQIDPRLPEFASNNGKDSWKGYVSGGGGKSPDGTDANTSFAEEGYYTRANSPLLLISYAEAMFIKAEAAFLANGGTTSSVGANTEAYNSYLKGIEASMQMYQVAGIDYISDASIAVGQNNLMLNHIMKEKYIHNFLNPETFVDYRRYNFSDKVFKGLKIRSEEDSDSDYAGQWFVRATYPSSELNRNRSVVEANQKTPVTPVWWNN